MSFVGDLFTDLVIVELFFDLTTRSAKIRFTGQDAEVDAAAKELFRDPTPLWPGEVTRAEVDRIDDGLQVSWYRWRRRTPSWVEFSRQVQHHVYDIYPDLDLTVERVKHPVAMVNERYRP